MTNHSILQQVQAIKNATRKATASKEAALRFLTEAGIVERLQEAETQAKAEKPLRR